MAPQALKKAVNHEKKKKCLIDVPLHQQHELTCTAYWNISWLASFALQQLSAAFAAAAFAALQRLL